MNEKLLKVSFWGTWVFRMHGSLRCLRLRNNTTLKVLGQLSLLCSLIKKTNTSIFIAFSHRSNQNFFTCHHQRKCNAALMVRWVDYKVLKNNTSNMQVLGLTASCNETYLNKRFSIQQRRSVVTSNIVIGNIVTDNLAPSLIGWRKSRSKIIRNITITRYRPAIHIIDRLPKYTRNTKLSILYRRRYYMVFRGV